MGRLNFPPGAKVYLDTAPIIYSTEKHAEYWQVLKPAWDLLKAREIEFATSELALMETLVQPIRNHDNYLIAEYDNLLTKSEIESYPITTLTLREAARIRATHNLKTPDAIHAATASLSECSHFVTNDPAFRRLENIEVVILSDLL